MSFIKKMGQHKRMMVLLQGIGIYLMLMMILFYLLYADLSSAPEFIYNQF